MHWTQCNLDQFAVGSFEAIKEPNFQSKPCFWDNQKYINSLILCIFSSLWFFTHFICMSFQSRSFSQYRPERPPLQIWTMVEIALVLFSIFIRIERYFLTCFYPFPLPFPSFFFPSALFSLKFLTAYTKIPKFRWLRAIGNLRLLSFL